MKNKPTSITPRDGRQESPWQHGLSAIIPPKLHGSTQTIYNTLIIGGGITGLTTALMLQKAGNKTILAEARNIGFGTTGGTSAHINTFADTTYKEAGSAFGEEGAQLFAGALNEGFKIIRDNISTYHIDCDYESKTAYLYAENEEEVKQLEDIYNGAVKVSVPVQYINQAPVPVKHQQALQFDGQAQFHPLKYLLALQREYLNAGGVVLENTKIEEIKTANNVHVATASSGITVKAQKVIYATHIPPGITVFSFRCAPYRSYVLAVKLKSGKYPDALIYDMQEPYHYFRTYVIDGEPLLTVGGYDHKTGHGDPEKAFADLEKYVRKYYNISSVKYKWSSQYYVPVDGLPYVGQIPFMADGIYCATGFNGNGMMLGSISAQILSDLVLEHENPYASLFSTSRIKPVDGFTAFVQENADVAYHFVAGRLAVHEVDSLKRLKPGAGKVVEFAGKKVAAYRDDEGTINALNPVCTHAKCIVNWNPEEKSWDCPCHGARFDIDGKVLNGPADKDLQKIQEEQE